MNVYEHRSVQCSSNNPINSNSNNNNSPNTGSNSASQIPEERGSNAQSLRRQFATED